MTGSRVRVVHLVDRAPPLTVGHAEFDAHVMPAYTLFARPEIIV
jgi:hypothetical protein